MPKTPPVHRFKDILLAASPGHLQPRTLRTAIKLAEDNGARLTVLDVLAPLPRSRKAINLGDRVIDLEALLLRDREERLKRLIKRSRVGPNPGVIVAIGQPSVEVTRHALTHGHDLVMVGADGVQKDSASELDSGVMGLLRKCPVPVWVMRPSGARKPRVLALVDPDPIDPVRDGLNDQILRLATSIVRCQGGELHLGHAWSLPGESTLRFSPYLRLPGSEVDAMVRAVETGRRSEIESLASRHLVNELGGSIHLVSGEPREALPELVRRLQIGLVVMGTVARKGISGLLMGNTAEAILRSVDCSVLAVKPEGFVTPVKVSQRRKRATG